MSKRQSMKRQSTTSQRKSMARKSLKRSSSKAGGGRRKSMGQKKISKKSSRGEGLGDKTRRGRDVFTYPAGDKYEGDWMAVYPDIFVRDGEGTYTSSDGTVHSGLWEIDLLQNGSITWPCGQKYSGEFKDGKMHGIGTYTFPGRGELSGNFEDNLPVGNVVFLDMAGMKYAGRIEPNSLSVRLKMMNHLMGGFSKEELVLPEPPKGVVEEVEGDGAQQSSGSKGSKRSKSKSTSRRSSKKRQSKSKSTAGGQRKSMKKRQSSVKKK